LSIDDARKLARQRWTIAEVEHAFPLARAVLLCPDWHRTHRLRRKPLLDTLLAPTYDEAGVAHFLTLNPTSLTHFAALSVIVR